jgi:hypothetical protein
MEDIFEEYMTAYQKASPNIKQLIDSEAIGEFAGALVTQLSLPRSAKRILIVSISNRVLGIISGNEIPVSLQNLNLSPEVIADLAAKIQAFVQNKVSTDTQTVPPITTTPVPDIPKSAIVEERANTTAAVPAPPVPKMTPGVPTIRTMAGDMAKTQTSGEATYSSTQEAILKGGWSTPKADNLK